jgi:hypothetical protein
MPPNNADIHTHMSMLPENSHGQVVLRPKIPGRENNVYYAS